MKYNWQDDDFRRLTLKIHGVDIDLIKTYPILKEYEFDKLTTNVNETIRYIVYAFDRNSPLHSLPDVLERRSVAAVMAGFTRTASGNFTKEVEDMIKCQNKQINTLIIRYCIMQASDDYTTLVTFEEALRNQNEKLLDGKVDSEKTKDMISNVDTLREKIKDIKRSLMSNNLDAFLERSLYDFSESARLSLRPEDYAAKMNV